MTWAMAGGAGGGATAVTGASGGGDRGRSDGSNGGLERGDSVGGSGTTCGRGLSDGDYLLSGGFGRVGSWRQADPLQSFSDGRDLLGRLGVLVGGHDLGDGGRSRGGGDRRNGGFGGGDSVGGSGTPCGRGLSDGDYLLSGGFGRVGSWRQADPLQRFREGSGLGRRG